MKRILLLFMIVCVAANMHAQLIIEDNNATVVDNIISGMVYPNISKDKDNNYYLVNTTECKTDNFQVLMLGKKDDALKTLAFFRDFIKNRKNGAFIDINDEFTGYKYRVFKISALGQGGLRFESLDNHYSCVSQIFIKSINGAIEIIESSE